MLQCVAGTNPNKYTDLAQLIQRYAERGENNGLVGSLLHPINVNPYNDITGRYFEFCLYIYIFFKYFLQSQ